MSEQFLRECYNSSGALSQYSYASKQILKSRYAALFESQNESPTVIPAVTRKGISDDLLTGLISERPVLLIGDVGVGKTTFIQYLRNIDAPEVMEDSITLYIDLGSEATLTDNLKKYIILQINTFAKIVAN